LTEELKGKEDLLAPYPLQGKFMGAMKAYPATANSNPDFKSYWAGQSAPLLKYRDARELISAIVEGMGR
jgi:nitronate monooxygenase